MTLVPNPAVAIAVTAYLYGPEELDAYGVLVAPIVGVRAGFRLDVQRECVEAYPDLLAFVVEPGEPIHDCGPNGVRLLAETAEELQAAAPPGCPEWPAAAWPGGACWDVWLVVDDEEGDL